MIDTRRHLRLMARVLDLQLGLLGLRMLGRGVLLRGLVMGHDGVVPSVPARDRVLSQASPGVR
jgi:hypothetical protein